MDSVYFRSSFWRDKFVRTLKPNEKLLYLYLFTNQNIPPSGIYEFLEDDCHYQTGLSNPQIKNSITLLTKKEKVLLVDGWIFVVNFLRKSFALPKKTLSKTIKQNISTQFTTNNIPDRIIACFYSNYHTLSIPYTYPPHIIEVLDLGFRFENLEGEEEREGDTPPPSGGVSGFSLPEFINLKTWQAFLDMRKAKGKKFTATEHAQELIIKDLIKFHEQGQDPNAILEESIKRSWTGVFPLKEQEKPKPVKSGAWEGKATGEEEYIPPLVEDQKAFEVWEEVKRNLKKELTPEKYDWLIDTRGTKYDGDKLIITMHPKIYQVRGLYIENYGKLIFGEKGLQGKPAEFVSRER